MAPVQKDEMPDQRMEEVDGGEEDRDSTLVICTDI